MADSESKSKYTFRLAEIKRASELFQESFSNLSLLIPTAVKNNEAIKYTQESENELENMLEEVKTVYSATCENVERLNEEYERLKKEADERILQEKFLARKATDLKTECSDLLKSKVSSKDELMKEITKMRYKTLRNMTQVRFAFDKADENTLYGFAFNHVNNKTKYFEITNVSKLNEEKVCAHIKACMKEVAGSTYEDIAVE